MGIFSIKKRNQGVLQSYIKTINKSCGFQNINKLNEASGSDAPIGQNFNSIAFDYETFVYNCQLLGFNPVAIYNSLGAIDFSKQYVIMRAKTPSTITQEVISNIGNNTIYIDIFGRSGQAFSNYYKFFVMCREGWSTVRFDGVDYPLDNSSQNISGKIKIYKSCGYQNINKLNEISGSSSIGEFLESVTLDYSTFVYNCELFGLDPNTISNSLGGVDFSKNYVIMRGAVNNTIPNETISNIGNNIIEISYGRRNRPTGIFYKFFVMCKEGWDTVRYNGTDYPLNN